MITAVEAARHESPESAQSILEFMLMLPVMLGLTALVMRVSSTIQAGIVNQQYARERILLMANNSPLYPNLRLRNAIAGENKDNQIIVGVSDQAATPNMTNPRAPLVNISKKTEGASEDAGTDQVQTRANVRVRTTVTMCLPLSTVEKGGNKVAVLPLSGPDDALVAAGPWNMEPNMTFDYCAGERWYK